MERMLVTQGLNELKTLDSRIRRKINNVEFVRGAKTCDKKVTPNVTKEEFSKKAESGYASVIDLIDRREKIKSAIVESNAKTFVDVCGQQMSVAKAIDTKASLEYKLELLSVMKAQLEKATKDVNVANAKMENQIDKLIETAYGKESKTSIKEDDYMAIAMPYKAHNEYSLVDPLSIGDEIEKLENFIYEFTNTIDGKLQVSNCVTYIEF